MNEPGAEPLDAELAHLKERVRRLAEDKSGFQLIIRLIERLNPLPGLEDMLRSMLFNIVECIGGTNIKLYYWVEDELHYMDFLGDQQRLAGIDDPVVARVARERQFVEERGGPEEALLVEGVLRGSWTWTFPLLVGEELIGVIKLENLHIQGAALSRHLPIFFSHAALILSNEIRNTIQRRAEAALRIASERLRAATEAGIIGIWDWDVERDQLVWDATMFRLYGRQEGDVGAAYQAWLEAVHPEDRPLVDGEIQAALRGEREYGPEFRVTWPDGSIHHLKAASRTLRNAAGRPVRMVGINYDLTERKRAEDESRAHMRFLEGMEQVNRALQKAANLEEMMADVLGVVLSIFDCDRAFLLHPCDPAAATWRVPMERTRPEYPGLFALGHEVATTPPVAETFRLLLAAEGPLRFGPGGAHPLPADVADRYGFKCLLAMAIRPKTGLPWQFGIHQCSHARRWTVEEDRLFEEIGRRLADGLSTLLAHRELADSERRFRLLFENSPVSIWDEDFSAVRGEFDRLREVGVVDLDRHFDNHPEAVGRLAELVRIADVNGATLALHEASSKAELMDRLANTFTPESFQIFRQELVELWQGRRSMVRDAVVKTLAGAPRHVTVHFSVVPGYEESLTRVLVSLIDITERKMAEQELERHRAHLEDLVGIRTRELGQARDAAESANRMKSIFLANMSHELRTPLNAILGFAQIMERDARIPADERDKLRTIGRSGRHLLALINDVLEISRIEAGRLTVQPVAFDLLEMLTGLREFVELRARDKGLALRVRMAADLPHYVRSDAGKLRQILVNLLTNAVKYTQAGQIELVAARLPGDGPTRLSFQVRDTGVGIKTTDLESIFQPFYQADYGAALGEGTGLGLTISRQYAQLLGGSLAVESEVGRGSVFHLTVPVEPVAAPEAARRPEGPVVGLAAGQPSHRVLVAEDDADSRYLLEELLRQAGFQVRSAPNGEQTVAGFLAWQPDFIWMDMRMPVMDGFEATRRIRTLPGGREVKIVALTASAFQEDRSGILAAGCDDVLTKPFDEAALFDVMQRLLGLHYRYGEAPDAPVGSVVRADLAAVPPALRQELAAAARQLDVEAVAQVAERIRAVDAGLADRVEELARTYRYDRIATLCEES